MLVLVAGVSALVPSVLLLWYFTSRDAHPEPRRVVLQTFGLGVLMAVPVLIVDLPLLSAASAVVGGTYPQALFHAFVSAAIVEEFFKFAVLWFFAARHRAFDEPMDGVVYGVSASLGFATLENVLYTLDGGLGVALIRALTAVPMHAFCGAIMGYYVGRARFGPPGARRALVAQALAWPMLLHGLYDFPLMATAYAYKDGARPPEAEETLIVGLQFVWLAVVVVEWVWAVKAARRLRREQEAADRYAREHPPVVDAAAGPGAPGTAPSAAAAGPSPLPPNVGLSWLLAVGGGAMSVVGALMALILVAGFAVSESGKQDVMALAVALVIVCILPAILGVVLLQAGRRRLRALKAWRGGGPAPRPAMPAAGGPPVVLPPVAGEPVPAAPAVMVPGAGVPGVVPPGPAAPPGGGIGAWLRILPGGILVTAGGLMTLGGILHLAQGGVEAGKLGGYLFALVLLGVLPSVGGSLLFERGLRRLPGPAPRRRSLPPA